MRRVTLIWCSVASAVIVAVACASVSGGSYRASSLRLFLPSQSTRLEEPGFTLLAGRLQTSEEVIRVLGRRSGRLAQASVIVQIAVMTGPASLRLAPGSLRLLLPSGEAIEPLEAERVLAAVSLPDEYWSEKRENAKRGNVLAPVEKPLEPGDKPDYWANQDMGYVGLIMTGLELAVRSAGAEKYREQARADVVDKTAFPREATPGARLDLLLVFLPPKGTIAKGEPVRLAAEIKSGGLHVERTLVLE